MTGVSRRHALRLAAIGAVGLPGCLTILESDPPPIDVSTSETAEIIQITVPDIEPDLPLQIGDEFVAKGVSRTRSLLAPIPQPLTDTIPNEAVREFIENHRAEARSRLDGLGDPESDSSSNYERLATVRRARSRAAAARGAYDAAIGDRTTQDVLERADALEETVMDHAEELDPIGTAPIPTLLVFADIESRLSSAIGSIEMIGLQSSLASTVEIVGESDRRLGSARARAETSEYLETRFDAMLEEETRSFSDQFRDALDTRLSTLGETADALPPLEGDRAALFDAPEEGTPRCMAGEQLRRSAHLARESATDDRAEAWLASGLLGTYRLEHDLLAFEHLRSRIEEADELERPADMAPIRREKTEAIAALRGALDGADEPDEYLILDRAQSVRAMIGSGDDLLELQMDRRESPSESRVIDAFGYYAAGRSYAETLGEATDRFVASLS